MDLPSLEVLAKQRRVWPDDQLLWDALLTETTTRRASSMGHDPLQTSPTTPVAGSSRRTAASENTRPALLCQSDHRLDSSTSSSCSRPTLEQLTRLARGDLNLGLVHLVTPNDSLASIALSYGCSQTSLRQANKLWLSDPIHFRKALTVPLEACTKKPAQEVLVEAHVQLDRRLICIGSCPSQPACASGQSESEEAEQLAAMAAARLVDFPDRRSSTNGSTGTSSRGSSFDLHRINPLSLHHQQNKSEEIQVSGAERFLPSTNNIYASDQVDAFEPSSEAVAPAEHARAASEAPSFSASQAATPDVVERTYKLVEIKLSGPTPSQHDIKGKSRPTLSNDPYASSRTRKLSFRLDEQLASPPPPRPVAPSASSSSTTLRPHNPPEALALSRRRARDDQLGSGGWDAMSVEELDMAKDIVRQVNASSPERDRSGWGHKRKDSRNRAVYQPSVSSNSSTRRGQAGSGTGRGWPGFSEISDILTDWVSP